MLGRGTMAFNQDVKAIIPGSRSLSKLLALRVSCDSSEKFISKGWSFISWYYDANEQELERFLIPLPDTQIQEEIAKAIETSEHKREIHLRKHSVFIDLFRTLLHQLMTAQIRLSDLDLS